ncbi:hypothetical protein D3C86_1648300 [compost metagenome]
MHLDADEVLLGGGSGHLQGRVAHAEADLEGARRAAAEDLVKVAQAVRQLQAKLRPALLEAALLALGHAPGTHHEALDGAQAAHFAGSLRRLLDFVSHEHFRCKDKRALPSRTGLAVLKSGQRRGLPM